MKFHSASSCHSPLSKAVNLEQVSTGQKGRKEKNLVHVSPASPHSTPGKCRSFLGDGMNKTVCSNPWFSASN